MTSTFSSLQLAVVDTVCLHIKISYRINSLQHDLTALLVYSLFIGVDAEIILCWY